jgi:hypothetical protein
MTNKLKSGARKARKVGKAVNQAIEKYPALQMVPYLPQAIQAANYAVDAADIFGDLMASFGDAGPGTMVTHPGAPYGQVAGVANGISVRRSAPKIRGSKGTIRITHKELVSSVANTTTLSITNQFTTGQSIYQVNAASSVSFPWLASIAGAYDYYRFKRVRLVYVPLCATTETGRIMLGYDPDSTDPIPTDRQGLSSYSCSTEGSLWSTLSLDLKLSDTAKWYYNDNSSVGSVLSNTTALIDQGQFFAATWSGGSTSSVGELYALYDVELKDPQPNTGDLASSYGTGANAVANFPSNFPLFNETGSVSQIQFQSFGSGTYYVQAIAAASATSAVTITGGTILSQTRVTDGTTVLVNLWFNGTGNTHIIIPGLTGLAKWTLWATRTTPQSQYVYT